MVSIISCSVLIACAHCYNCTLIFKIICMVVCDPILKCFECMCAFVCSFVVWFVCLFNDDCMIPSDHTTTTTIYISKEYLRILKFERLPSLIFRNSFDSNILLWIIFFLLLWYNILIWYFIFDEEHKLIVKFNLN